MQTNKQTADAGKDSVIYQANGDIIINAADDSIILEKIRTVSLDVFKANFYDLGEDVRQIANRRAEEITNQFIEKLLSENPHLLENTSDPDIRYDLFEIQKSYARLGDQEMADLLVDILVERTKSTEHTFKNIALNESLNVIPKLTSKQIDVITLIYLVRYYNFVAFLKMPFDFYYQTLEKFLDVEIPNAEMFYQHLQYSGCLSISIASSSFASIFMHKFPHLFSNEAEFNSFISSSYTDMSQLKNKWDNTKMCHTSLSSVGLVIAMTNINRIMNTKWDMGIWFQEN